MAKEKKMKDDEVEKLLSRMNEKCNCEFKSLDDLSDIYNASGYIDLGNVMVNLIVGGNWKLGMPNNVSYMFIGKQDSGKSLITLMMMKSATDNGYVVFYYETEGAISQKKMKEFGINTKRVIPIDDYDHLVDLRFNVKSKLDALKIKDKVIFVYDSIAMVLESEKFTKNEKEDEKKSVGKAAQEINDFFKANVKKANRLHKPQIFVNRTYQNMNIEAPNPKYATEEQKETISGGSGSQFGVSAIIKCKKEILYTYIKYKDEDLKDKEKKTPFATKFTLSSARKNRVVKPGMDIYFIIHDKKGLMKYSGITPFAQQFGYLEKARGGWKLKNDEKVYKTLYDISDESWEKELNSGLGDLLNKEFEFANLYDQSQNNDQFFEEEKTDNEEIVEKETEEDNEDI